MREQIQNQQFDEERSLYHLTDTDVIDCIFAGPADGESVLKECRGITVTGCSFSLRYPLWHADGFTLADSFMDDKTRAPLWYATHGMISGCGIDGIKTLRECEDIRLERCIVHSPEFGWRCHDIRIAQSVIDSEYFLFETKNIWIDRLRMTGKYSFQYTENMTIENSLLDTKDAFWHCKNVTVKNSVVRGEYLGWYSDGLTLIDCQIIGTQPLCYCKNLRLVRCTMHGCDLAFEYSDVEADIIGSIDSVKNPKSGKITADAIGEIIREDAVIDCHGEVVKRGESPVSIV